MSQLNADAINCVSLQSSNPVIVLNTPLSIAPTVGLVMDPVTIGPNTTNLSITSAVAIGDSARAAGTNDVSIGKYAGLAGTVGMSGGDNIAIGEASLTANILGAKNVGVGTQTLYSQVNKLKKYGMSVSQTGNTVTGINTTFTSDMVGGSIYFVTDAFTDTITGFINATSITVLTSNTFLDQPFEITTLPISYYGNRTAGVIFGYLYGINTNFTPSLVGGSVTFLEDAVTETVTGYGGPNQLYITGAVNRPQQAFTITDTTVYYGERTASCSFTTVTGVNTTFTADMVGGTITLYENAFTDTITGFINATTLTVATGGSYAAQAFNISYTATYNTGTASITGTVITGIGTGWYDPDIGNPGTSIYFVTDAVTIPILYLIDGSTLWVAPGDANTLAVQPYVLSYPKIYRSAAIYNFSNTVYDFGGGSIFTNAMVGGTVKFYVSNITANIGSFINSTSFNTSYAGTISPDEPYKITYPNYTSSVANQSSFSTYIESFDSTFTTDMVGGSIYYYTDAATVSISGFYDMNYLETLDTTPYNDQPYKITYILTYAALASISGNNVTGIRSNFTDAMVGGTIKFLTDNVTYNIDSYISPTSITVVQSNTLTDQPFEVTYGLDLNVGIGYKALYAQNGPPRNTAIGAYALTSNVSGEGNTAVGYNALQLTTVNNCTAVGYNALALNTDGQNCTALGYKALAANTFDSGLTAIGSGALSMNDGGTENTAVGYNALANNIDASLSTAVGYECMEFADGGLDNIAIGYRTLRNVSGVRNVAIGNLAGQNLTSDDQNVFIGADVLRVAQYCGATTVVGHAAMADAPDNCNFNTAVGYQAMWNPATVVINCVAIGYNAMPVNVADNTIGIGRQVLENNTTGTGNVAVGYRSLRFNVTGTNNTALGYQSLLNVTSNNNTGLGYSVGSTLTNGIANVLIGSFANVGSSSDSSCVVVGQNSTGATSSVVIGQGSTSNGVANSIALGSGATVVSTARALAIRINAASYTPGVSIGCTVNGTNEIISLSTGASFDPSNPVFHGTGTSAANSGAGSVTIGASASTTGGTNGTAVGSTASVAGLNGVAVGFGARTGTGTNNTIVGYTAGAALTTGQNCTALGYNALAANTSGNGLTAVGSGALQNNINTGTNNTAVGFQALNTTTNGDNMVAIGHSALLSETNGTDNVAVGYRALTSAVGTISNVAVGTSTLESTISGIENVAIGAYAMQVYDDVSSVAVGAYAMISSTTGSNNVMVGYQAGSFGSGFVNCTGVGYNVLRLNNGIENTAFGSQAIELVTSGTANTAIGRSVGTTLTTGSNNVLVGRGANVTAAGDTTSVAVGQGAVVADSGVAIGQGATLNVAATSGIAIGKGANLTAAATGGAIALGAGITANQPGGLFVQHQAGAFIVNAAGFIAGTNELVEVTSAARFKDNIRTLESVGDRIANLRPVRYVGKPGMGDGRENIGLIAEEVEPLFPELVTYNPDGQVQGLMYERLASILLKEVQEMRARITELEAKLL